MHIEKRTGLNHVPWIAPPPKRKPRAVSPQPHWQRGGKGDAAHPLHPTGEFKSYDQHKHGEHDHHPPHKHPESAVVVSFDSRGRSANKRVTMPNKTSTRVETMKEQASKNALERRAMHSEHERARGDKARRDEWVKTAVQR